MTKKIESLVPDTSIIIEGLVSQKIKNKEIEVKEIIIHEAVLAELEHQANLGKSIGYIGLDEIKTLKEISINNFELKFMGKRPLSSEIKYANLGEIDSLIRQLAWEEDATLLTADVVQSKVAEAKGMKVIFIEAEKVTKKLKIERFFDKITMSVHLRENVYPYAKKGRPGNWKFAPIKRKKLSQAYIQEASKEIIEGAKIRKDGFLEIERKGSSIVQLGNLRIVITRPPFSDGWEITAVRPVKSLSLQEYKLDQKLLNRIENQAEGLLIAGAPGHGKTTFAQALAEFYASKDKIVKTVEAPRDLQLKDNITQYAISHGTPQEIYDVLLLSRPDYTIFDEMRNTNDFNLFADLRLAGIGFVGVVHATNPIDAIQRFLGRVELGVIPQIIDTVIFIKDGNVNKILNLMMTVKVPSGMTEADLARPVVEVRDFITNKLEYEIYSYGEETVVIPVKKENSPSRELAAKEIERYFRKYTNNVKVDVLSDYKAIVKLPQEILPQVIGKQGKTIDGIEKTLGISIDLKEIESEKKETGYNIFEKGKFVFLDSGNENRNKQVGIYVDNNFLFNALTNKRGIIKLHSKSNSGKTIKESMEVGKTISIKP